MTNEELALAWKKSPQMRRKIESVMLSRNNGYLVSFMNSVSIPQGYYKIILNYVMASVHIALDRYNHESGIKFISYWTWWMREARHKAMKNEYGLMQIKSQREMNERNAGLSKCYHVRYKKRNEGISIDAELMKDEPGFNYLDIFSHYDDEKIDDIKQLILSTVEPEHRKIFSMLMSGMNRKEISERIGICRERVRQIICKYKDKVYNIITEGAILV